MTILEICLAVTTVLFAGLWLRSWRNHRMTLYMLGGLVGTPAPKSVHWVGCDDDVPLQMPSPETAASIEMLTGPRGEDERE